MIVVAVMADRAGVIDALAEFREQLYQCMTQWADALFELTDALLCTDGPVKTLVGLSLAPEHRRGHGAMYDALNHGRIDVESLRRQLVGLRLPRAAEGRLVLARGPPSPVPESSGTGFLLDGAKGADAAAEGRGDG